MVTMALLKTEEMPEVPKNVEIVENYGSTPIVNHETFSATMGDHIVVRGDESDVSRWLRQCGQVWVTQGPPQFERFNLMDFSENPES